MIFLPDSPIFKYREKIDGESVIFVKKVPLKDLEEIKKINAEYKDATGKEFIKLIY